MNITRLAIENNRLTLVLLFVIVVVGIQTFLAMPRAYDPGFIVRAAQITTYMPGASPERVEELVSSKLEEVIKEIPELDFVSSESRTNVSIVVANVKESFTDMRPIWDKLRRKVDDAARELPEGTLGPYVNDEFGDVYGIVMTLSGEGFNYRELNKTAEQVRDALQRLPEAAKVEILGAQEERVFVEYNNAQLAALGISPNQFSQILEARNIVLSGGSFNLGDERISLEPSGNFDSIEDIEKTILAVPGSDNLIYLKDVAKVTRGYVDPPSNLVRSSGVPALGIAISMREGGNNILLGEQVTEQLKAFNATYPWGIDFDLVNFSPREVDAKVKGFVSNLLQAILVVTLVMLLSLGLRTGLVVSALIPISMLLALLVMQVFAIGLDQISLAALIIALGMLVDNGIVMSESIMVQMEQGKKALDAAIDSADELKTSLLTASLTTAAAFLPIYLAESSVGEFTASLFKVVTITLLCSWLISLTLIPLLCVQFLKVKAKPNVDLYSGRFYRVYRRGLAWLLHHPLITVGVTVAVFAVAMSGFSHVPKVFFPPSDRTYFKVELELPAGTAIEKTQRVVANIDHFVAEELAVNDQRSSGVTNWVSYVGDAGPRFLLSHNPKPATPGYALMVLNVTALDQMPTLMARIREYALATFPDLEVKTRLIENGPAVNNPVGVRLISDNNEALFAAVAELKQTMSALGTLTNIQDDWGQRIKKLNIQINQQRALRAGMTSQDIALSLQAGLSGLELTEYREGEDVIPVIMRSSNATANDISKVESLSVYIQSSGLSVPLRQVADINVVWDASKVLRRNGLRTVTVGAQLQPGNTSADQFAQLIPWLQQKQTEWGLSVRYELGGENESSGKANESIGAKLPVAGFIILILLVAQFNSIRKPVIILTTIPLGLVGVVSGLLVGQSFFGFMTLLGVISLAGIVINNAIVLLERIQIELDSGLPAMEAIIHAAQQRARPILLTTATTVLGLIPLYLGGGEMWEPMAISIMAGLMFSTALTLGVVPVLYALFYRIKPTQI